MFDAPMILQSFVYPAIAALVVAAAVFALARGRAESDWRMRLGFLPVAAAYLTGHLARYSMPSWGNWQAVDAWQWMLPGVAAAALAAALDTWAPPTALRWALRLGLVAALAAIMLNPFMRHTWARGESLLWIGAIALAGLAWWAVLSWLDVRLSHNWFAANWLAVLVGAAALLILSGTQRLFEMCVMLGAGTGAMVILQSLGAARLARGLHAIVPLALIGIWINAWFYGDVPWWRIAVPAAAPLAIGIVEILPRRARRRGWAVGLLRLTAVAAVLAAAVAPTARNYEPDPYEDYMDY